MPKQVAICICKEDGKIVKSWTFVTLHNEWYTYDQLCRDILNGPLTPTFNLDLPCKMYNLKEITASSTLAMSECVRGTSDTDIIQVIDQFGMRFFKLIIEHLPSCATCLPNQGSSQPVNAFTVLMTAARDAVGKDLPTILKDPKTSMEKLNNEVLGFFEEKECNFPTNAGVRATSFVSKSVDLLYYVDGHYNKIESVVSISTKVPTVFKTWFSGFNCPEKHKHRKRNLSNLSEQKLEKYTIQMREVIQGQQYLNEMPWAEVKTQILSLGSLLPSP